MKMGGLIKAESPMLELKTTLPLLYLYRWLSNLVQFLDGDEAIVPAMHKSFHSEKQNIPKLRQTRSRALVYCVIYFIIAFVNIFLSSHNDINVDEE
jgi:hypothetical protein